MLGLFRRRADPYELINGERFVEMLEEGGCQILDVRSKMELREGLIKDAFVLPYLSHGFKEELSRFDKKQSFIVICRNTIRSKFTCDYMAELNFKKLFVLQNGVKEIRRVNSSLGLDLIKPYRK